ncbi:hypothetical protein HYQ45_017819 [Verticillium longisporum]|uniref:CHRD domain-containing protein n=1 Tax=Verticillium longisporum TaxID=100787 RepID=A0A0G4KRR8_VERLO|nr:hypothetical protein HYQ45_017819 [Verticillium longisporum]KAG7111902.1 hypothetical protein HYQ44_010097 [Verticillium longisporum]CRK12351.1 hypothetical protein BN1708_010447 [Verticillium longisporum]
MRSSTVISAFIGLAAAKPVPVSHPVVEAVAPHVAANGPFTFTSTYNLIATPDRVINADNEVAPGEAGSMGYYNYGINSELDIICYNITLTGVTGPYDSPAVTATHIHEAAEGASGPPRIAFPNPEPADSGPEVVKRSSGCIQGPFTTGIENEGVDTGTGFTLAQIEANPEAFFTDSHTVVSVPGVVRAQLQANAQPAAGAGTVLQPGQGAAAGGCSRQVVSAGPPFVFVCVE